MIYTEKINCSRLGKNCILKYCSGSQNQISGDRFYSVKERLTMSKNMQLTVSVRPYYEKNLEGTYPKIGRYLRHQDSSLANLNPSLYELAGLLDQLLYRFDGTLLREALLRHQDKLREIHKSIQDNMADWNLSQVDKLLYSIEDIFDEIESELD